MKPSAIFFDLGGTLLRPRRDKVLQIILESEGVHVPLRSIHEVYYLADAWWEDVYGSRVLSGEEEDRAFKELDFFVLEKLGLTKDRIVGEQLADVVIKRWFVVERSIEPELYPEVQSYLQELGSRGYTLGLISNAPPETRETVSKVGLDRQMDHIVISGVVGVAKPDPAIFRYALNLASAKPEESMHVGDSYKADVLGATGAGLRAVLLDRDKRHRVTDCPRIHVLPELDGILL